MPKISVFVCSWWLFYVCIRL